MEFETKFDSKTEELYQKEEMRRGLKDIRIMFIIFSFLYALFFISDYFIVHEHVPEFFTIRFLIVSPMFIITFLLSYKPFFIKTGQLFLLMNFVVAGAGISYMLIIEPGNVVYYGGMFMIYFSGYLLLKLNFINSLIGGWTNLILYIMGFIVINGEINRELVFPAMFFIGANMIGMAGSYGIEKSNRKNFQANLQIMDYNNRLKDEVNMKIEEINMINVEIVFALAKLAESRDKYTGTHLESVGEYCRIIAEGIPETEFIEKYGTRKNFQNLLEISSALHDVGKVGISDSILLKNGKLTGKEFEQMKNHTLIGWEILEKVQNVYPNNEFINMGVSITRHHHERYDGLGYPDGLSGKEIPISARIMALCDTYDALTSKRPYKEAYAHEVAFEIIKQDQGKQFDPGVVQAFVEKQEQFKKALASDKNFSATESQE